MRPIIIIILIGVIIVLGFIFFLNQRGQFNLPSAEAPSMKLASESGKEIFVTEGVRHSIPLAEIVSGGPPKDGIPAIDSPKFVSAGQANEFLDDQEPGLGVFLNGEARFYPYQILVWHEIVNDTIKNTPILVTYCPLCATGILFEREFQGPGGQQILTTFGTSGKLWNNNLLMYNRTARGEETLESLWSQILGEAVVGPLTGTSLKFLPSDTITYSEWKKLHPSTKVLSRDTGFSRTYGFNPYGNYYVNNQAIYFPTSNQDNRLEAKDLILGVEVKGQFKAYEANALKKINILNDNFVGEPLLVVRNPETDVDIQTAGVVRIFSRQLNGQVPEFEFKNGKLQDKQTSSTWSLEGEALSGPLKGQKLQIKLYIPAFWFSWVAAHPQTALYK